MTSEYKYLKPEQQKNVDRHIKEREKMMAEGAAGSGAAAQPLAAPGPVPEAPEGMGGEAPLPGSEAPLNDGSAPAEAPAAVPPPVA